MPLKVLARGSSAEPDTRSDAVRLGVCVIRAQASATFFHLQVQLPKPQNCLRHRISPLL